MKIAIIGNAADKFTLETEALARNVIRELLVPGTALVSGGCHLGGIDIWAEEEAVRMAMQKYIFLPEHHSWERGYKPRNLKIAETCDELHVIVAQTYPPGYKGKKWDMCYHCHQPGHVKSGACWTAKQAMKRGKPIFWHIVT